MSETGSFLSRIKGSSRQFQRFVVIGILATLVHTLCAIAVVYIASTGAFIANIFGYCAALQVSYFGHTLYSFEQKAHFKHFLRFAFFNTWLFVLSLVLSYTMDVYSVNSYIGVIVTACALPPISFLVHKFVTFK